MRAIQIDSPGRVGLVDAPDRAPNAQEVMIRVMASGICGTDIHILRGEYLGNYPVIPGHEFSGVVEQVGTHVTRFKPGDRVAVEPNIACDNCANCLNNRQNFCLNWQAVGVTLPGGMAERVIAPEKAVFGIGDLPFEQAAFMEPLSCVLHGVERLSIDLADHIALLGAGPIGILLLRALRLQGAARVSVVERNPARLALARAAGADECFEGLDALQQDGYDAVVDATGVLAVLRRSLDYARPGGKVLWFGVPPSGQELSIEPFKVFRKGLTVLGSFTSLRNSIQAVELLQTGRLQVADIISHRLPLAEFERGCEMIERGEDGARKIIILPNE